MSEMKDCGNCKHKAVILGEEPCNHCRKSIPTEWEPAE